MEVPQGKDRFEMAIEFQQTGTVVLPLEGTSIGPPGSGGTAPSSSSLLLTMNGIASSSLLESDAVALRKMATLFLSQNTGRVLPG